MTNVRRTAQAAALSVAISLLLPRPAWAAWETVPTIQLGVLTEDNPRLETDGPSDSSTAIALDAQVDIASIGQRGTLSLLPRIRTDKYSSAADKELESTDIFLDFGGDRRWRSGAYGFLLDVSRESVRRAELAAVEPDDDPDVDDPIDTSSGELDFINQKREYASFRPYIDFQVSQANSLRIEGSRTDVSYSEFNIESRTGFIDTSLALRYTFQSNERNTPFVAIETSRYEAEVNSNETKTVQLDAGLAHRLNQLWTINLTAGLQRSDFAYIENGQPTSRDGVSNYLARIQLRKRAERSSFNVDLTRDLRPSSNGFVTERDELRAYFSRSFSPRLSGRLGFRISSYASLEEAKPSTDRDYRRFEASLEWAIDQRWFLAAGYNYTAQNFVNDVGVKTKSNLFNIGVAYRGLSRR